MHQAPVVQVAQARRAAEHDRQCVGRRQPAQLGQPAAEVPAIDVFHRQKMPPAVDAGPIALHDVRVTEPGHDPALAPEAAQEQGLPCDVRERHLDGRVTPQADLPRQVDRAHRPAPQPADENEVTQHHRLPRRCLVRSGQIGERLGGRRGGGGELASAGSVVGCRHRDRLGASPRGRTHRGTAESHTWGPRTGPAGNGRRILRRPPDPDKEAPEPAGSPTMGPRTGDCCGPDFQRADRRSSWTSFCKRPSPRLSRA